MNARELCQHDSVFRKTSTGLQSNPQLAAQYPTRLVLDALALHTPKRNESVLEIGVGCGIILPVTCPGAAAASWRSDINADFSMPCTAASSQRKPGRASGPYAQRVRLVLCSE